MPSAPSPAPEQTAPRTRRTALVLFLVTAVLALTLTPPAGDRAGGADPDAWLYASTLPDTLPPELQGQLSPGPGQSHDGGQDDRGGTDAALAAVLLPEASGTDDSPPASRRRAATPAPLKDTALAPRAPPAT